jgi:NADH-quinone oxidoreductase subunit N
MTSADLVALAPLVLVALTAVVTMLVIAVTRRHTLTAAVTFAGMVAALVSLAAVSRGGPRQVGSLLVLDTFGSTFSAIVLLAGLAVVLLAHGYLARLRVQREELYVLVACAVLGALVLTQATHFASLFLGLETLSVSLFALVGYLSRTPRGIEAGLKYLVLASVSSAVLLFGLALVYAGTGTLELGRLAQVMIGAEPTSLTSAGAALVLVGFGFKLALVPFHLWTADVYQGAPAPVTTLVATVSKAGAMAALIRFVSAFGAPAGSTPGKVLALLAAASMIMGNLLALRQNNVKRLLAFSSIAQLGYVVVAFLAGGRAGVEAATFYLAAYVITLVGAFGTLAALSDAEGEPETLADLRGLFWDRPLVAGVLTACLLSLAGIPVTAGFVAKFYVLTATVDAALWTLVLVLVITSVVGLFYYLRVIVAMLTPAVDGVQRREVAVPFFSGLVLALATLCLVVLGIAPRAFAGLLRLAGV